MALATDSNEKGVGPQVLSQIGHNDSIITVGRRLTDGDFVKLKFLCSEWIETKNWLSITNFDQLVTCLEAKKGEDFLTVLTELLYIVQRYDLLKVLGSCKHKVENEERKLVPRYWKYWFHCVEEIEVDNPESILERLLPKLKKETRPGNLIDLWYPLKDLLGSQGSILETWKKEKLLEVPGAEDSYEIRESGTYGLCIIINNEIFDDPDSNRRGTEVDKGILISLFESFDFEVETKDNLTTTEMKEWIVEVAERSDRAYDCFACCILTHGIEGSVQGVNTKDKESGYLKIQDDIIHAFCKAAKAFIGKPKLFFINACQGTSMQRKQPLESNQKMELEETCETESNQKMELEESCQTDQAMPSEVRPNICDYLLSMATIHGHVAYRHPRTGTWFVNALREELSIGWDNDDVNSILLKVNNRIAKAVTKDNMGQTAVFHCALVKNLYLRKKHQPQEAEET